MTIKAMLLSITILISMFFVEIERSQFISMITVTAFIFLYVRVPPILTLFIVVLSWSTLYKNNIINEANTLIINTELQHNKSSTKVAKDNIITAELITLVNNKNRLSFDVKVIEINHKRVSFIIPRMVLKWSNPEFSYPGELAIGQIWRFKVSIIDTQDTRLFARHIRYTGIIHKGEIINPKFSLRGELYQIFKSLLPDNPNPMLYALSFGDRSYIGDDLWTQFKLLGVGHLVAISGLHIGLIFGFCFYALQRLFGRIVSPYKLCINLTISLLCALFYAWIAGFSLPALRAIILLSLHCLYRVQYFKVTLLQTFFMMLLVTLALDPLTVFSVSFWLSFSAMAAVFILVWFDNQKYKQQQFLQYSIDMDSEWVRIFHRAKLTVQGVVIKAGYLCKSQLLLTALMLPIQVTVFSGFSVLSVFVNLIFIPIFSLFILPVLLVAVIILPILPSVSTSLLSFVNSLLNMIAVMWGELTTNDVVWISLEAGFDGVNLRYLLLLFVLIICGAIFKPMRVTLNCLSLLLLPIIYHGYVK